MSEPSPRITSSHAAEESEGGLFGISTGSLIWVVPIAVVALGAFLILARTRSAVTAALLSIAPAAILIGAVRFIQNSGPVGFLLDHVSQIINGGNSSPLPKREHFQPPLFSPFPNGYLSDGLIVFGGLNGWVARGFTIETPDFQNASFSERNRAQECWSAFLRVVPEKWRLQFRVCDDDAGFAPRLLEYAQHTSRCVDPAVRKLRNANFLNLSSALEKGQLRRRQQTLFIGFQLSPGADGSVSELEMAKREFGQCEQTLRQCLAPISARVMPLPDQEVFRQWVDAFNPSIRLEPDYDPLAGIQHPISLLENAWRSELRGQGSQGFVLDGFHHLCFTIKRLPTETYFTILHSLAASPFSGVTVTAQIRRLSKEPILREAQSKVERIHHQLVAKPDQALAVTLAQLEAKIRRLTAEGVVPMEIEVIVVVRASSPEELRSRAAAIKAAIHRMNGAQPFEATLASSSRSLFAKSLPAWMWSSHDGCTLYVEDPTGANLLPLAASFSGHPGPVHSLFPGSDGGLVNVVSFLGEQEAETPQQLVVLGGTGMGKSQVVTKLLIETSGTIAYTAVIEDGLSQAALSRALGSEPLIFKPGGTQTINFLDTNGLPRSAFWISTAASLVSRMLGIPKAEDKALRQHALVSRELMRVTGEHAEDCFRRWPRERREAVLKECAAVVARIKKNPQPVADAFLDLKEFKRSDPVAFAAELAGFSDAELRQHEHGGSSELYDLVFAHLAPDEHLTLSSLRESLELSDDEDCRWLAVPLTPWCRGGPYGRLFDGPTNIPLSSRLLHYEMGFIPEGARDLKSIVAFASLNTIRNQCLSLPKLARKRVVIDEISRFFDVPGGEEIVRELFESFRKHNTQIIIIGQQYSRIADSLARPAIMGNASAWFIFNTGDAQDIARLGADLGLSQLSQEAIKRFARPDQMTGSKYSEFLYLHKSAGQPICGAVRYYLLPCDQTKP